MCGSLWNPWQAEQGRGTRDNLLWHQNLQLSAVDVLSFEERAVNVLLDLKVLSLWIQRVTFFLECLFWNRCPSMMRQCCDLNVCRYFDTFRIERIDFDF
ncbi:hypothetical protein L195_g000210 [Trifolium pratense]|uniref:Uncharacterized protein n=1 Tax=Trifolium pratense TaxID=57577 RepID=A0A2K3NL93_TRIPR|nr:hypothetical protein L195_g000210 [Trifolium pratense]